MLLRTVNHLFRLGPWLPWRTVSHNQRVTGSSHGRTTSAGFSQGQSAAPSNALVICRCAALVRQVKLWGSLRGCGMSSQMGGLRIQNAEILIE